MLWRAKPPAMSPRSSSFQQSQNQSLNHFSFGDTRF